MRGIYPEYTKQVAFYAVGTDPFETLEDLEEYRRDQGHPWPVALPLGKMLSELRVRQQSTKVAVDAHETIIYRDGYGRGDEETWRQVFRDLAASIEQ